MSRKSSKDFKHTTGEEKLEQPSEQPISSEAEKQTEEKIPEEQLLREKIDELNDKYLRLYSEFDNYRRRTIKERIELGKTASSEIITDLLPVLDDFERAIKSAADSQDCNAVKEGVNLIYTKFTAILEKKGLKVIDVSGQDFNTDFHEAITYVPAPTEELKNKIVDEIEKGYILGDKVIRYSKVIIGQ
jgi:molecular chaperone GrpE